jgi:hypothetical protein
MTARVGVFVALLVTLLGGWLWGASGRSELVRALQAADLRNDLLEAHASLLGARVNLCDVDFGALDRQLENARGSLGRASVRAGTPGQDDERQRLNLPGFGAEIDEARRLAAMLSSGSSGAVRVHDPTEPDKTSRKP